MPPTLVLTPELRAELKKPLGRLIRGRPDEVFEEVSKALGGRKLITVGDVVTHNALGHGLRPWTAIVDGRAMRKPFKGPPSSPGWKHIFRLVNQPGTISGDAWGVIGEAIRTGHSLVLVEGEEDLLTIVAVLCAPEGSVVLYGQPGEGAVLIEVNRAVKKAFRELVASMRPLE